MNNDAMMMPIVGKEEIRRAKRRNQSKLNQRKYRAIKKEAEEELHSDVKQIQRFTRRLKLHKGALERGLWCHSQEKSVLEYLQLFEHGYDHSGRQNAFLKCFVSHQVGIMGLVGIDALKSVLDEYRSSFPSYHIEICHLNELYANADEAVIESYLKCHLPISIQCIKSVLPHLLDRPDIMNKIMGKTLVLPYRITFFFDGFKIVQRMITTANIVEAFYNLLENLEDVATTALEFRMLPDGKINPAIDITTISSDDS